MSGRYKDWVKESTGIRKRITSGERVVTTTGKIKRYAVHIQGLKSSLVELSAKFKLMHVAYQGVGDQLLMPPFAFDHIGAHLHYHLSKEDAGPERWYFFPCLWF